MATIQEYNNRILTSISTKGIVPSAKLEECLGSSDTQASNVTSVNVIRKVTEESIQQLVMAKANGIIPICVERKNRKVYTLPDAEFKQLIADRVQSAVLFIIDPSQLSEKDQSYKYLMTPNRFLLGEVLLDKPIPFQAIKSIVVPEKLKDFVSRVFKGIEIHTLSLVEQMVYVDIPHTVKLPEGIQMDPFFRTRDVQVQVPDYIPFLTAFSTEHFKKDSNPLVFHVTRLSTAFDLQSNP